MAPISYKAKAPGSMMFFGEHAVLHHKQAIVFAIDRYVTVTLNVRTDQQLVIHSALGHYEKTLSEIKIDKPFQFVLAACLYFKNKLQQGFELTITSEFSDELGLGSSAAVTVATVAVLSQWLGLSNDIFLISKSIIQSVQGVGSGADVAASVYGGILVYQMDPPYVVKQFIVDLPLVTIYSGSKTPTPEVIQKVESVRQKYPEIFQALFETIEECTQAAIPFIETEAWESLGELMNIQQGLMNALGVGTPILNDLVDQLLNNPKIYGAKISGSGLGDCIIGLGQRTNSTVFKNPGVKEIAVGVSRQGIVNG